VPRISDPKVHALWRERVRLQGQSGLTIAEFCTRDRLSAKLFYAWRRRLQRIELGDHRSALPTPAAFLPVTVRLAERATHEPLPIEADLPIGIRLRIPTGNANLACRLLRAVAGAQTDSGGSK
jgi:hypothetical protein